MNSKDVFYIVDEFGYGNNPLALVNSLKSVNCFDTIEEANNYYMQIRNNYPIYKLVISSSIVSQEEYSRTIG